MPESMNHQMQLSWLRDRIATSKRKGEPTEALEACLNLGLAMAKLHKEPVTFIDKTLPPERN